MKNPLEIRKEHLRQELDEAMRRVHGRARRSHWAAICLMLAAILCSVGTGIAGLTEVLGQKLLGALALVPGAAAIMASRFKLQTRSNWHYRKYNALSSLKSRLLYQLPVEPTAEQIAAIAEARDTLNTEMDCEWRRDIAFDWSDFKPPKTPHAQEGRSGQPRQPNPQPDDQI